MSVAHLHHRRLFLIVGTRRKESAAPEYEPEKRQFGFQLQRDTSISGGYHMQRKSLQVSLPINIICLNVRLYS